VPEIVKPNPPDASSVYQLPEGAVVVAGVDACAERCGATVDDEPAVRADVRTEQVVTTEGTNVLASFADGPVAGSPAVTRRRLGEGAAWYVATRLHENGRTP